MGAALYSLLRLPRGPLAVHDSLPRWPGNALYLLHTRNLSPLLREYPGHGIKCGKTRSNIIISGNVTRSVCPGGRKRGCRQTVQGLRTHQ